MMETASSVESTWRMGRMGPVGGRERGRAGGGGVRQGRGVDWRMGRREGGREGGREGKGRPYRRFRPP